MVSPSCGGNRCSCAGIVMHNKRTTGGADMNMRRCALAASLLLVAACATSDKPESAAAASAAPQVPYRVDASWPKPLRGNWMLGQVAWVAVDSQDHVWILHRPGTLL